MKKVCSWGFLLILSVVMISSINLGTAAPLSSSTSILYADKTRYDSKKKRIYASGHVEIYKDHQLLQADHVVYDENTKKAFAHGNVRLQRKDGHIIFSEHLELSTDFKDVFAKKIAIRLKDNGRIAAYDGERKSGKISRFRRAVYSRCEQCKKNPSAPPLWQVSSRQVIWDEEAQKIVHRDAYLEMWGVPVLYTPYLTHPDPSVLRQSGILSPEFYNLKDLGFAFSVPYFWAINRHSDLTLTPVFISQNDGQPFFLKGHYRYLFTKGQMDVKGSITSGDLKDNDDNNTGSGKTLRGHLNGQGQWYISPHWRGTLQIQRVTDQTYFRRYNLDEKSESFLTSYGRIEGFSKRSYLSGEVMNIQSLHEGDGDDSMPSALPSLHYEHISRPRGFWGGQISTTLDTLNLYRPSGNRQNRFMLGTKWQRPILLDHGQRIDLGGSIGGYVIQYDNKDHHTHDGCSQVFPQVFMKWEWPFVKYLSQGSMVLSPQISMVGGPRKDFPDTLNREDSILSEFNDENIMDEQRFTGYDSLDVGQRINLGLKWAFYSPDLGHSEIFFGQSFGFQEPTLAMKNMGLIGKSSGYVMRFRTIYKEWWGVQGRALLDQNRLWGGDVTTLRTELDGWAGPDVCRPFLRYAKLPQTFEDEPAEQMQIGIESLFAEKWKGRLFSTRSLGTLGKPLTHGLSVGYEDECFKFDASAAHNFYKDRDVQPGFEIKFTLSFKTLGGVQLG
jgi:LPS-assembly protein